MVKKTNIYEISILIITIIPVILQVLNPSSTESIIFLGIIILISIVAVAWEYLNNKILQIETNTKDIKNLEDTLNTMKQINELDKRLSIIENKRKAQINPQILIIFLLLVLLYLYLRSAGYI